MSNHELRKLNVDIAALSRPGFHQMVASENRTTRSFGRDLNQMKIAYVELGLQ